MTTNRYPPLPLRVLPATSVAAASTTSGHELLTAELATARTKNGLKRRQHRAAARVHQRAKRKAEDAAGAVQQRNLHLSSLVATSRAHVADAKDRQVALELRCAALEAEATSLRANVTRLINASEADRLQLESAELRHDAEKRRLAAAHAATELSLDQKYAALLDETHGAHQACLLEATSKSSADASSLRAKLRAAEAGERRAADERDAAYKQLEQRFGPSEARLRGQRDALKAQVIGLQAEVGFWKHRANASDSALRDLKGQLRESFPGKGPTLDGAGAASGAAGARGPARPKLIWPEKNPPTTPSGSQ